MKHVVSISIGSAKRNHRVEMEILGEQFIIERIGTDGDLNKAIEKVKELDGTVDAFGMGGIDLYLYAGGKRYTFRDAKKLAAAARLTPMLDGSGLKNSLERWTVGYVQNELNIPIQGKKVLMVSAVDRFGMAEAFVAAGGEMVFGDLIFGLGVPVRLRSLRQLYTVANALLPILTNIPFQWVYPTGEKQEKITPKFGDVYEWADIIAGDWHYIRRYMPDHLDGKLILTNTVTPVNVQELKDRGASMLVTTTPDLNGRSFGTNVMEAVLVTLFSKRPEELSADDYLKMLARINFQPRVENFGQ